MAAARSYFHEQHKYSQVRIILHLWLVGIKELVETLHRLDVEDSDYAVTYARLVITSLETADRIQPPAKWSQWTRREVPPGYMEQPNSDISEHGKEEMR
ncbi:hypothetical protein P691DRAFT_807982 [Macrolepiota fuliginosa MF-IS2]|uniref:Uncharacterized protein n=1 Tax=Macrolepiota fuliginosa MF-IS2 TaxID=1400762 RepID=A0A9P5X631_9AGAR|nr:hypothetical protein P691DRAFT_807982 [Macrolepiota fuliginosa MF-IS2]